MNKAFSFVNHESRHATTPILKAIGYTLMAVVDGIVKARKMHRDYETLSAMSNLELEDMGISRSDIHAVVTRTYCGARPAPSNGPSNAITSAMVCRAAWSSNGVKAVGPPARCNSEK